MDADVRWEQRFESLERALALLREPIDRGVESLSPLECEGMVHRFEFALELCWKTMKDYLEREGVALDSATPRAVVKAAFGARLVIDGQVWIDMLDHRNLLSHTYDRSTFDSAVIAVAQRYYPAMEVLRTSLAARRTST